MHYVTTDQLNSGDVLGRELLDMAGHLVMKKGSELNDQIIRRLTNMGIAGVYVADEAGAEIIGEPEEPVLPEPAINDILREEALSCVKEMNVPASVGISEDIVKEMIEKHYISLDMEQYRPFDDYTYSHSVNVAVLSCAIGMEMGLEQRELHLLVNAAILHDFGKLCIPEEIVNRRNSLSGEEYLLLRQHVEKSYELIQDKDYIADVVKLTVLCHHENEDASGYPNGIGGEQIPLLAKILHVADVYDFLVTEKPYKPAYDNKEAAEYLMGGCDMLFYRKAVEAFLRINPLYPIGKQIHLSNGDVGIVLDNRDRHATRPVIRSLQNGSKIDLLSEEYREISILTGSEVRRANRTAEERSDLKRIMVVDDMNTNLQVIREILDRDYKLILVKSGDQALNYLERNPMPDLIMMDIDMPHMTGIECAKIIRKLYKEAAPVLFVSSLHDVTTVLECRRMDAAGFIVRPYQSTFIRSEISRILDGQEVGL